MTRGLPKPNTSIREFYIRQTTTYQPINIRNIFLDSMQMPEFKLERYFAKYEFNSKFLLSASDCETLTIEELLKMAGKDHLELLSLNLGYTDSQGHIDLRTEISKLYENIKPSEVLAVAGAEEGIYIAIRSLLRSGDHVIVQTPCYQSMISVAESQGITVTKWIMDPNDDWELNLDQLRNSLRQNTKMIIINFPHNPTGAIISHSKYEEIIKIAKSSDLILFSDEVYRLLELDEKSRLRSTVDMYKKAISLGVMSKAFGLAGLRLGWIVCRDKEILNALIGYKDYTTICNNVVGEYLATLALSIKEQILQRIRTIIDKNILILDDFMSAHNHIFSWVRPKGSSIGYIQLQGDIRAEEFCSLLVKATGVLLLPSIVYGMEDNYFRIGFGRENFSSALEAFGNYLQGYRSI